MAHQIIGAPIFLFYTAPRLEGNTGVPRLEGNIGAPFNSEALVLDLFPSACLLLTLALSRRD